MNLEDFINWNVSIDYRIDGGKYQGEIESIDQINQTIRLKNAFQNGILLQTDSQHSILIQAKRIEDLTLLPQPNSNFQISKTNSKKSFQDQQQFKIAPIAQNNRIRSVKSLSDENDEQFDPNKTSKLKFNNQEKHRCDQMILEHNNEPINYEQIHLSFTTNQKYLTDQELIISSISKEFRDRLYSTSELFDYSIERRIESMGRCTSEMLLHLLGGSQRLTVKNRHQHPIIIVLACLNDYSGAYAICAARILATKNIRIYLFIPPNSTFENSFIENELKLFRTTQSFLTHQIQDLPQTSPVDLIWNGIDCGKINETDEKRWDNDLVKYCSQIQTSIIGVDPPSLNGNIIQCKYSLISLLRLNSYSTSTNLGRLYLCDLAFGKSVF